MPAVIERDIRLIVVKKIELNCGVARPVQKELIHRISIWTDSGWVGDTMCVLKDGLFFREETEHRLLSLRIAICPEWLHGIECTANTLLVGVTVLNDDGLNLIWML